MKIALFNATGTEIAELPAIVAAMNKWALEMAAMHQEEPLETALVTDVASLDPDVWRPMAVLDNADEQGVLGDHETDANGRPTSRVFVKPITDNGGTMTKGALSLSVAATHELGEIRGNPFACDWSQIRDGLTLQAKERCDLVESQSYEIDGIAASNFLGPRAFSAGPGPYDRLGLLANVDDGPGPGNYRIIWDVANTSGPTPEFGDGYAPWKKELKAKNPASRFGELLALRSEFALAAHVDLEVRRLAAIAQFGREDPGLITLPSLSDVERFLCSKCAMPLAGKALCSLHPLAGRIKAA